MRHGGGVVVVGVEAADVVVGIGIEIVGVEVEVEAVGVEVEVASSEDVGEFFISQAFNEMIKGYLAVWKSELPSVARI